MRRVAFELQTLRRGLTRPLGCSPPAREGAVVLLSGGLDSTTVLAIAKEKYRCFALSFDYGQRHRYELEAAQKVAVALGAEEHKTVPIDLRIFGGSALTSDEIDVPKGREESAMAAEIPVTYVPARNTIFLSYALAYAEVRNSRHIFIGANAVDYSGYPDCRPEYFEAFQKLASLATKQAVEERANSGSRGVRIHTPLLMWTKKKIIEEGLDRGVDFGITHSCYDPGVRGIPCGNCDSCQLRRTAFKSLGYEDDPAILRQR